MERGIAPAPGGALSHRRQGSHPGARPSCRRAARHVRGERQLSCRRMLSSFSILSLLLAGASDRRTHRITGRDSPASARAIGSAAQANEPLWRFAGRAEVQDGVRVLVVEVQKHGSLRGGLVCISMGRLKGKRCQAGEVCIIRFAATVPACGASQLLSGFSTNESELQPRERSRSETPAVDAGLRS